MVRTERIDFSASFSWVQPRRLRNSTTVCQAGRTKFPLTGAGFCVKLRSKCTSDSCSTRAHGYLMGTSDDCRTSEKGLVVDLASPQAEALRCFESHRLHRKDIEFHAKRFFC